MKRWIGILMVLTMLASGCAPKLALEPSDVVSLNVPEGVSFVATKTVFPLDTAEISTVLINGSQRALTYGVDFALETLTDGDVWMRVPYKADTSWIAIAMITDAGQKAEFSCSLGIFPALPEGTYRIVKHAFLDSEGASEEVVMAAQFILSDDPAEATGRPQTQIPNPLVSVEDAKAFETLDLYIDAPERATDVAYTVIADAIADVRFTLDDHDYTYRAAHTEEEIHGVYETFDVKKIGLEADGENWSASVQVRSIDGGKKGALATWRYGDVNFSLYTAQSVDPSALGTLAVSLAEKQYAHHMPVAK